MEADQAEDSERDGDGDGDRDGGGKKKKKKGDSGGRSVETLFKVLYRNHVELTAIADTKANIMVGINGLLTSVSLGAVLPRIAESDAQWLAPAILLILGCGVSLACAILSARPRVSTSQVSLDDMRSHRANLMFFGHFTKLTPDDYALGLRELIDNADLLREQMARDIHQLGFVLTRKYRLLWASYTALLVTVVASIGSALALSLFA
ncbi:MAG: hypothetical protein FJ091_16115 [Deltaproteobacteria bacterium]|nr:hypothetical protein [Deltaproteobacteria bacterium]